jgi:DNA-binding CsgD family transcriptional regulator
VSRRRAIGACFLGLCALELDRVAEAARVSTMARDAFGGRAWWFHSILPDWLEASMSSAAGDNDRAAALLEPAASFTVSIGAFLWADFLIAELAEVSARSGSAEPLRRTMALLDREPASRRGSGDTGRSALALVASGAHAAVRGKLSAADTDLRDAIAGFASLGWVLWEARARVLLAATVPPDVAEVELGLAAATFRRCGAVQRAAQVDNLLADLAARSEVGSGTLPAELTKRERQVASLAAEGLSSPQIASRLFIGRRTVESHLAHVYAKLDVHGRRELAHRLRSPLGEEP